VEDISDFTQYFAAFKPITLPQKSYFEHDVENEKWKILLSLPS